MGSSPTCCSAPVNDLGNAQKVYRSCREWGSLFDRHPSRSVILRPDQQTAVGLAREFFATAKRGDRRLYAAPTGWGKSYVQAALLQQDPEAVLVTPRKEIVRGLLQKLGHDCRGLSEAKLQALAESERIWTPKKFLNRLEDARVAKSYCHLVYDEQHHHNSQTYQDLDLLLNEIPSVGYTATPYRGTPKGTAELIGRWGQPHWLMRYPEAVAAGIVKMPSCRVIPLVDDDVITVSNGEFVIQAANEEIRSRAEDLVRVASDNPNRLPTMMALPSVEACWLVHNAAKIRGIATDVVTGETSDEDRQAAFDRCIRAESILLQIFVVSEGVDLPIRRLIDARPTMSPVVFMQTLGRVMRPTEQMPEYLCCCRNLERFCYLLDGLVPSPVIKEAQTAFNKPSDRTVVRAIGFEAVGKFKATELPLKDGLRGHMYGLTAVDGIHCVQWAVLLHPAKADPIVAARKLTKRLDGTYDYQSKDAKWVPASLPDNMTGFASSAAGSMTPAMKDWWKKSAGAFGLDPNATPNRRSFQALPVLANLRTRI